jgi:fumarate reductase (CoM/CoB) subunit A
MNADVRLVTKAPLLQGGSTVYGASEIMSMGAAGFGDSRDNPEIHFQDTMRAAAGFIDPVLVQTLAEEAPLRIRDLIDLGVPFDRTFTDDYKLIKSDFGSYARAMGVSGKTGRAFVTALAEELTRSGVQIDAPVTLLDLILDSDGVIAGALGYDMSHNQIVHYEAPSIVLGTGGVHGAFEQQVSTPEMTGDGQAICFRHGAELINLEFHQFGPALIHPYVQLFSKSCFALHPKISNREGDEFLPRYLPAEVDMAHVFDEKVFPFTTTNVSRYIDIAIAREVNEGRGTERGCVNFSFAHVPPEQLASVMPNTLRWMRDNGVVPEIDCLEVGIAFQCMNGGVRMATPEAESTIPGLYVIGELAGGVRGPDRPGGNSLAEGQVFGHRAGEAAARRSKATRFVANGSPHPSIDFARRVAARPLRINIERRTADLRKAMQRYCLVEKSEAGLETALGIVRDIKGEIQTYLGGADGMVSKALSFCNLVDTSELLLVACLHRMETRSGHYRVDHPETDNRRFGHSFVVRSGGAGGIETNCHPYPSEPVPQ